MIRLIARAFRLRAAHLTEPYPDLEQHCEVLWIAHDSDKKGRIVWCLRELSTKAAVKWLDVDSAFDASALASPWERIELFAGGALGDSPTSSALLDATPRLAFDTIADTPAYSSKSAKWTWNRTADGQPSPALRKDGNKYSHRVLGAGDRSCLFFETLEKRMFLIANVRIRNLLGRLGDKNDPARDVVAWQFVVDLGPKDIPDPGAIWSKDDLKLRDILCCAPRIDESLLPKTFASTLRPDPKASFPVREATWNPGELPGTKSALRFNISATHELPPWTGGLRFFAPSAKFPNDLAPEAIFLRGGLLLVDRGEGPVTLRFIARPAGEGKDDSSGVFLLDTRKRFAVQDQCIEGYAPRGRSRAHFVEWRVFYVRPGVGANPGPELAAWWTAQVIAPLMQSLLAVRDGSPLSLAPVFEWSDKVESTAWMAAVAVRDHSSNVGVGPALPTGKDTAPAFESSQPLIQPAELLVEDDEELAKFGHETKILGLSAGGSVSITTYTVVCHPWQQRVHEPPVKVPRWAFAEAMFALEATAVAFALRRVRPSKTPKDDGKGEPDGTKEELRWLRVGALEMALSADTAGSEPFGWDIVGTTRQEAHGAGGPGVPTFRWQARLPMQVRAGAVDRMQDDTIADVTRALAEADPFSGRAVDRGFETEVPVVIALEEDTAGEALLLRAQEAVDDGLNHNLRLQLFVRGDSDPSPRQIMILDRAPFGVYLVQTPALSRLASAESNEVAIWDAAGEGGAHWRLAEPQGGVEIFLPPQGVGEAMDRRDGPAPALPLDMRFTPHARLQIDPSFQDQRYGEAAWNVRRLFGYAEQRTPGSRLLGFDVELMYGLTAQARELDDVMIAEVESRLGRPAGRQAPELPWQPDHLQKDQWTDYRARWSATRRQLTSRLGVLETYGRDGREPVIREGLAFYQRGWGPPASSTGAASAEEAQGGPSLRFPMGDYAVARAAKPGVANALFERSEGLAGGWTWGFASLNILEAVLRDPHSTSGFLTGLKFSALGGWGIQKASFDEDRSAIHSHTTMGRTHYYSLERIGRIAVCWNRAKHVIVFERIVEPGSGCAMLRLIEEYVEVIECDRPFPESDAPKSTRGCVTGLHFKSRKIPVDRAWGQDVGDIGWRIALWNPADGKHPRPQIHFGLAGDPDADVTTILGLCSTPELLYFYTDTRQGTGADTDRWEPIRGVDYGVAAAHWMDDSGAPTTPDLPSCAGEAMDLPLPPDIAVAPGLRAFTFGLETLERPVNLSADRAEGALNALLRNITLMRASPVVTEPLKAAPAAAEARKFLRDSSQLHQEARKIEQQLRVILVEEGDPNMLATRARSLLAAHVGEDSKWNRAATEIRKTYTNYRPKVSCDAVKTAAQGALGRLDGVVHRSIRAVGDELVARIRSAESTLATLVEGAVGNVEQVFADHQKRLVDLVREMVKGLTDGLMAASGSVVGVEQDALGGIDEVRAEVDAAARKALDRVFSAVTGELTDILKSLDAAELRVDQVFTRLEAARGSARAGLQRALESLDKAERAAAAKGKRLGKLGPKIRELLAGARTTLRSNATRIDEALGWCLDQRPRARELKGQLREAVVKAWGLLVAVQVALLGSDEGDGGGALGAILTEATALQDAAKKNIAEASNTLQRPLDASRNILTDVVEVIDTKLTDVRAKLGGTTSEVLALAAQIRAGQFASVPAQSAVKSAEDQWSAQYRDLHDTQIPEKMGALCDTLSGTVVAWLEDKDAAAAKVLEDLQKAIEDKLELDVLRERLERGADEILGEATAMFEEARSSLEASVIGPVLQNPDSVLRLVRAFGDPPKLPQLSFNRVATAFVFGDSKAAIDITPATAWFNQVGDDLKALGIRLPTGKLLDRLIPLDLRQFDFGKLLPDFAGLKLDRLFPGLKGDAATGEGIVVKHGLDKQRQRAWIDATVKLARADSDDLFRLGPLALTLHRTALDALASIAVGVDGKPERQTRGSLIADWELAFGGQPVVTFRRTALRFDESGRMDFDLKPDRIELAPALKYLSDLAKLVEYDEDGFTFRILERGGLPYGAEATFGVALPPLQYGTTGIVGATIGAGLRLEAYPDFALTVQANVSRRDSPFVFSVFILGGAGFVEVGATYLPFRNALTADVSISLAASASLAFGFGVLSGQVAVLFGVSVEYHRRPGQGGGLDMGLFLQVVGRVDVKCLVSVNISLRLAATYTTDARITASGSLSIRVRISRFFKFTVSTNVTYDFKSGRSTTVTERRVETHPAIAGARKLAKAAS
jgi:hypothetical protein